MKDGNEGKNSVKEGPVEATEIICKYLRYLEKTCSCPFAIMRMVKDAAG